MKRLITVVATVLIAATVFTAMPQPAQAHRGGGYVVGAVIGGLALGAILASQHHRHRRYYAHGYRSRHVAYRPVYYASYAPPRRSYRHYHHRHYRYW